MMATTRSRMSLATRHASRIFSAPFAFLIGIISLQSNAKYRRKPSRDRDCHQCDATRLTFGNKKQVVRFSRDIPSNDFAELPGRRHFAASAVLHSTDRPRARKNSPPPHWLQSRNYGTAIALKYARRQFPRELRAISRDQEGCDAG